MTGTDRKAWGEVAADHRRGRKFASGPRRHAGLALVLVGTLALAGCEAIQVATGARMRLDGTALTSLAATPDDPKGLAPGSSMTLTVIATTSDGRQLATAGAGGGKVLPDSYAYQASVATVDADGVVSLPADPRMSAGQLPHVRITPMGRTDPAAELDIPIRYDVSYKQVYAGMAGHDGLAGIDGLPGVDGMTGSSDPGNPQAGGNGSDGGNGQPGGNGGDGFPGPAVQVWIALDPAPRPLLRVRVDEGGRAHFFLIDPDGGSLTIDVSGGAAGRGGAGGRGGTPGQGGLGMPNGSAGMAGRPGSDGLPGTDGGAGQITVHVDPAARTDLDRFHFTNVGGSGLAGPPPSIVTEAVPAAW